MSFTDITTVLDTERVKYLDLTHQLNNYNEIYNVNFYLKNMNSVEYDRLNSQNDNMKSKNLRMRQEYMMLEYAEKENIMRTNIILFTIVISCVVLSMTAAYSKGKMSSNSLVISGVSIIIGYFLVVLFILYNEKNRRKYAYNQYYWSQPGTKKK